MEDVQEKSPENDVQPSTPMTSNPNFFVDNALQSEVPSILVKNAYKSYGKKKSFVPVLSGLHMTVERGQIYGLLGPSGAGKTTLINCILGLMKLDAGIILLYGSKPGNPESAVPGPGVGYMPQELALFGSFTIKEILQFFGLLFGLKKAYVKERISFLLDLLDLPAGSRFVRTLSGGQARRVSFALAMLQEPKLMILDEPTVGVDPLLREKIWDHLVNMSRKNCAMVLTTHYAEETRRAHKVGFLRGGHLVVEGAPEDLLNKFSLQTLEAVFLTLAHQAGDLDREEIVQERRRSRGILPKTVMEWSTKSSQSLIRKWIFLYGISMNHIRGLVVKNALTHIRNIGVIVFSLILPMIQASLFCICIGGDPKYVTVNIVNEDATEEQCKANLTIHYSCWFIDQFKKKHEQIEEYSSFESALQQVKDANAAAVINIPINFTQTFNHWKDYFIFLTATEMIEDIQNIQIEITMDESEKQTELYLTGILLKAYENFGLQMSNYFLEDLGVEKTVNLSDLEIIYYTKPIYGGDDMTFTDFIAPGVLGTIVYFLSIGLTTLAFIVEQRQGLLNRLYVAGVTNVEILLAHTIVFMVLVVGQIAVVMVLMFLIFQVAIKGSIWLVLFMLILTGICGIAFGFLMSSCCETETSAIQAAIGSFYPVICLSGVMWPITGMSDNWRYFALSLPMTMPIDSIRNIILRDWTLSDDHVWEGYVVCVAWIFILFLCSIIALKIRFR